MFLLPHVSLPDPSSRPRFSSRSTAIQNTVATARRDSVRRPSIAKACINCYSKKIRCDLSLGKLPCSNCVLYSTECKPRQRRKRQAQASHNDDHDIVVSMSLSHSRDSAASTPSGDTSGQNAPHAHDRRTPKEDTELQYRRSTDFEGQGSVDPAPNTYPEAITSDDFEIERTVQLPEFSPAVRRSYIGAFFNHCFQYSYLVKKEWLEATPTHIPSTLLLHAVMFAGRRFASSVNLEHIEAHYRSIRTLFFSGVERNPVLVIITSLLMQCWNPAGPERFSMDNADTWNRLGVGFALQVSLHKDNSVVRDASYRRRLWWALVARDFQISAAHDRPRAIAAEDIQVPRLTVSDFPIDEPRAHEIVSYSVISHIFGDVGECYRRKELSEARLRPIRNELFVWTRQLPSQLRLFQNGLPGAFDGVGRQLHLFYFVTVILLLRADSPKSIGAVLAASFASAIFEDLLLRDEVRYFPALNEFFLLTVGITLLQAGERLPGAIDDLRAIKRVLKAVAERHPSSLATLQSLERIQNSAPASGSYHDANITSLQPRDRMFFEQFGPGLCREWHLFSGSAEIGQLDIGHETNTSTGHDINGEIIPVSRSTNQSHDVSLYPSTSSSDAFASFPSAFATSTDAADLLWPMPRNHDYSSQSWLLHE